MCVFLSPSLSPFSIFSFLLTSSPTLSASPRFLFFYFFANGDGKLERLPGGLFEERVGSLREFLDRANMTDEITSRASQ